MNNNFNSGKYLNMLQSIEFIEGVNEARADFLRIFTTLCPTWSVEQIENATDRCAIFQRTSIIQEQNAKRI